MGETKDNTLNFEASSVEACRICLATDIKLHSLQGTYLATCMEAIVGFQKSCEGLPNYICYECAPCLVKCHKLIEKSKITQTVLEDIYSKNRQISKPLIEEQNRTELKLQTLDSYLLSNYYYIKYDDDNNTSDFIKIESDPAHINIKLKNELKEEIEEVSDTEILKILTDSVKNQEKSSDESQSGSDVEAIEVDVPLIEILSDDEKVGDDFISLKTYNVRVDTEPGINFNKSDRPIYNRARCLKPKVKKPKRKRKKRNNNEDTPVPDEPYVQRYFNIIETPPVRASVKTYSCKSCSATFKYPEEAKDHTFIGCPRLENTDIAAPNATSSVPGPNSDRPNPKNWDIWPGSI